MSTSAGTAARKPSSRAAGAQRTLVGLIGLLGLAAGLAALLAGAGLLGADRAPVLGPLVLDTLRASATLARAIAVVTGAVLLALGLVWAARAVKPEYRPDLLLDPDPDRLIEVNASAIAHAVRADAETITGVNRARARMVGTATLPVLRLNL